MIDRFAESGVAGGRRCPASIANVDQVRDLLGTARERAPRCSRGYTSLAGAAHGTRALSVKEEERDQSLPLSGTTHGSSICCGFHSAIWQGQDAGSSPAIRPGGRRQARQPGHLLRADRPLHRRDRTISLAAAAGDRRYDGKVLAATTASSISPSASGRVSRSPAPRRFMSWRSTPRPSASWSVPARR